jgi:hypothetical protein
VEGVEGLAELRPRRQSLSVEEAQHRHVLEDPLTTSADGTLTPHTRSSVAEGFVQPPDGKYEYYDFFYLDRVKGPIYIRAYRNINADPDGKKSATTMTGDVIRWITSVSEVKEASAEYGAVIRGIRRTRDREFGIAGTEIILVDRRSGDVLAVRRDFVRSPEGARNRSGINWDNALSCLRAHEFTTHKFFESVLIPRIPK